MRAGTLSARGVTRWYRGSVRPAIARVTFDLPAGRTLAVVGESGAGKSTLARILAGLEKPSDGFVAIDDHRVQLRPGRVSPVQMVFQNPFDALNPLKSIGTSVAEPLRRLPAGERRVRVESALARVGLDPRRGNQRPGSFSGGQLQRIVLARALVAEPSVLICDEPTSSLDVSVQAQVVNLLLDLQSAQGFSCLLVTHDLGVARVLADEILVLRFGEVLEHRSARDLFAEPAHAYTRELLAAERPAPMA
jgi:ABC-type glutathione transport system ATPase component